MPERWLKNHKVHAMKHPETVTCRQAADIVGLPKGTRSILYIRMLAVEMGVLDTYDHDPRRTIVREGLEERYAEACRNGDLAQARLAVNLNYSPRRMTMSPEEIKWKLKERFRVVDGVVIKNPLLPKRGRPRKEIK